MGVGERGRQREDHVKIVDRQQIGLARRQPIRRRRALTFWAMAVATRVVSDTAVAAILAALDMPAECGRAALRILLEEVRGLCRNVCGETRFLIPAAWAAA